MGEKTPDWLLQERSKQLKEREASLKLEREVQQRERSVKHLEREVHPSRKRKLFNVSKKVGKSLSSYVEDLANQPIQSPRVHKRRPLKKKRRKKGPSRSPGYGLGVGLRF